MPAASSRLSTNSTIATQTRHDRRADEQHVARADRLHQERGQRRAGRAAKARAAADEAEHALGLPRVVDVVGQRPELADEQHREDQADDVEGDGDPVLADRREQEPEQDQQQRHAGLRDRDGPAPRHRAASAGCSPA